MGATWTNATKEGIDEATVDAALESGRPQYERANVWCPDGCSRVMRVGIEWKHGTREAVFSAVCDQCGIRFEAPMGLRHLGSKD